MSLMFTRFRAKQVSQIRVSFDEIPPQRLKHVISRCGSAPNPAGASPIPSGHEATEHDLPSKIH